MSAFTESVVEQVALAWFESAGWQIRNGRRLVVVSVAAPPSLIADEVVRS